MAPYRLVCKYVVEPEILYASSATQTHTHTHQWMITAIILAVCAARSVNSLPTFRDNYRSGCPKNEHYSLLLVFLTLEDGTDKLSRNVGKELPLFAAERARRAQFSATSWRKSEITHHLMLFEWAGISWGQCGDFTGLWTCFTFLNKFRYFRVRHTAGLSCNENSKKKRRRRRKKKVDGFSLF